MKQWFTIECKHADQRATIYIFDEIGFFGVSAKDFAKQLKDLGEIREIELHINSPGGSVFDGLAIYNLLNRHAASITVFVDGLAASIASVIVMAGDTVIMPENALLMLHRPSGLVLGNADDMRRMAELLEKTEPGLIAAYRSKTGLSDKKIAELMHAETWLTAAEAVELGFADRIEDAVKIAAHFDLSKFNRAPANWPQNREKTIPNDNKKTGGSTTPQPLNIDTLQAALPDSTAEFQIRCLTEHYDLAQARDAWQDEQIEVLRADAAALKAKDAETAKLLKAQDDEIEMLEAAAGKPGLDPVSDAIGGNEGGSADGSAKCRWKTAITAKIKEGMTRAQAAAAVHLEDPQLRIDLVQEANPGIVYEGR